MRAGWPLWGAPLFLMGLLTVAAETDEATDLLSEKFSETTPVFPPESSHVHARQDEPKEPIQYRTAEIADAMMGNSVPAGQSVELSLIPAKIKEGYVSKMDIGTCDAAVDGECSTQDVVSSLSQPGSHAQESLIEQPVVLEAVHPTSAEDSNSTDSMKTPKVNCEERNITGLTNFTLQILNISQVPFYLSTRFGTVAVPNILLFQGAKPMARFNHTDRTLETLKTFIFNQTGIEPKTDVIVTEEDQAGPLPSTLSRGVDWLLLFSLLFLISFIMYATVRTESIRWLIPGQDQEHQE
ncbi:hypothetical protein JD844_012155 [Phrynosoma platyrhinos]|uniref:Thioredoxin domain-containing protein 15 n=1 Tax=Phrynosoma platyrhinos TaxID=52577 RepID=A0ABQ7TJ66_PHRPL|nr:hypothetical protein JD844_012155 [Phrynosoma platyrhinos]